jgi:hypothetical protein
MSFTLLLSGCLTPPMGIGRGATAISPDTPASLAAGTGLDSDRRAIQQVDFAWTKKESETFSYDIGAVYTQVVARDRLIAGGFPYIRPRWTWGGTSFALAGSVAAFSGGEGGVLAGFLDVQLGHGGDGWSIYTGAYASAYAIADGGPIASSAQIRAGAELLPRLHNRSQSRMGLAAEVFRQVEYFQREDPGPADVRTNIFGGAIKLRVAW